MKEQRVSSDVFYDQGDGEFQVLSSELIGDLEGKVIEALGAIRAMTYSSYSLSDKTDIITGSVDILDAILDAPGDLVLIETQLSAMTMQRQADAIERVMVITTAQRVRVGQVVMHHDYEDLHTLTEAYVDEPLRERYVIYRYVDGSYDAGVEQYDLLDEKASLSRRSMTLYDACELLAQLDDAAARSAAS